MRQHACVWILALACPCHVHAAVLLGRASGRAGLNEAATESGERGCRVTYLPFVWNASEVTKTSKAQWFQTYKREGVASQDVPSVLGAVHVDEGRVAALEARLRKYDAKRDEFMRRNLNTCIANLGGNTTTISLDFLVSLSNTTSLAEDFLSESGDGLVAEFADVRFDDNGCIFSPSQCHGVANGGCVASRHSCSHCIVHHAAEECSNETNIYSHVIGLDSMYSGMFHSVAESFAALAHLDLESAMIHSEHDPFIVELLRRLGVDENRIITGPVFAERLTLPEKARCGSPSMDQLSFLRSIIRTHEAPSDTVLLITRRKTRVIGNPDEVREMVALWARSRNLNFYHFDEDKLPSIPEQYEIFSRARVIVGPQGAASTLIVAAPEQATYIEFDSWTFQNPLYMRFSVLLGFTYYGLGYTWKEPLNTSKLSLILESLPDRGSDDTLNH